MSVMLPNTITYKALVMLALVAFAEQSLGKEENAMFRAHSDSCVESSRVDPRLLARMLSGEMVDEPSLRKHVYCVLLKCKIISKDGKLQKNAVLAKLAARPDAKNAAKIVESCASQSGDSPEDLAWNLFRCGYDKKAMLFAYMPSSAAANSPDGNTD